MGTVSPGLGVPIGGTINQRLVKRSSDNYDTGWEDPLAAGLDKAVQFNDAGILGADPYFRWNKNTRSLLLGILEALPDNPLAITGAVNLWLQANIQNTTEGSLASSDFVVTADNGTDLDFYGALWIASSVYDDPDGYPTTAANDVVLESLANNLQLLCWKDGSKVQILIGESAEVQAHFDEAGLTMAPGKTIKHGASEQPIPEIYYGTGSPPSATGLPNGALFFKYTP
jgi:hypothetical protein